MASVVPFPLWGLGHHEERFFGLWPPCWGLPRALRLCSVSGKAGQPDGDMRKLKSGTSPGVVFK